MLIPLLSGIIILLLLFVFFLYRKAKSLEEDFLLLQHQKMSQSVKYGKLTEQFIPFTEQFSFNPGHFRFLGSPIDGIVFADDKIVFCEFKTGKSQLNENQKAIKRLVEGKRVEWFEFKMK